MVQQVHCSRRSLLRRGLEFHVCTINKSAHTKKVWKLIVCTSYICLFFESLPYVNTPCQNPLLVTVTKNISFLSNFLFGHRGVGMTLSIYKGRLKSSYADKDTPIECDKMTSIFQQNHTFRRCCSAWIPLVKSNQLQIWGHRMKFSANELFSLLSYIYIYIYSKNTFTDAQRMIFGDVQSSLQISVSCTSYRPRLQLRPGSGTPRTPPWQLCTTYFLSCPDGKYPFV